MPSYLEIALRAATPLESKHEQQPGHREPKRVVRASEPIAEAPQRAVSAACGSPYCAGCYDVGDGRKMHPPKCGQGYLDWLKKWEGKGRVQ